MHIALLNILARSLRCAGRVAVGLLVAAAAALPCSSAWAAPSAFEQLSGAPVRAVDGRYLILAGTPTKVRDDSTGMIRPLPAGCTIGYAGASKATGYLYGTCDGRPAVIDLARSTATPIPLGALLNGGGYVITIGRHWAKWIVADASTVYVNWRTGQQARAERDGVPRELDLNEPGVLPERDLLDGTTLRRPTDARSTAFTVKSLRLDIGGKVVPLRRRCIGGCNLITYASGRVSWLEATSNGPRRVFVYLIRARRLVSFAVPAVANSVYSVRHTKRRVFLFAQDSDLKPTLNFTFRPATAMNGCPTPAEASTPKVGPLAITARRGREPLEELNAARRRRPVG